MPKMFWLVEAKGCGSLAEDYGKVHEDLSIKVDTYLTYWPI